ncbi:hypothetical protein [Candidatus Berkiella aquae]|uniref:Uncharacterized protein n=1 Tax=Candidatus Berkiella aquae TaxID=295108 RepID=A0A0Q9YXG2_9GAMM|nr:hypothetical protein [Candidatus Berkiella aquae]MCS5711558.1 hypothetical protein [Candidatus Berkiella aquae]
MKNMIIKTAVIGLIAFSASAFAEKLIITGEPVILEKQGDLYVVPETYKVADNYQFAVIDGTKRACFLEKKADFASLNVVTINVKVGGQQATWNCYPLDTTYFEVK